MPGHVKQFEGIKWYSKGKLSKDLDWEDDDDNEFVLIEPKDIQRGLAVYSKGGLFGTIEQIRYVNGIPLEITIRQPAGSRFICPMTKFFSYKFQKKKND